MRGVIVEWLEQLCNGADPLVQIPAWINRVSHRSPIQTEKPLPECKQIMPEMRFTKFPALSIDPRIGISRSALETDD